MDGKNNESMGGKFNGYVMILDEKWKFLWKFCLRN